MEFNGLKIGGNSNDHKNESTPQTLSKEASDYIVEGAGEGLDLLSKVKKMNVGAHNDVVYGVYNNADRGLFTRIDDFLIDHSKVTLKDKSYFFHMLAVMVDAGIPVVQAVKSLAARTKNKRFARILNTVAYNSEHGATLSQAMMRFEDVFDESEIGIVKSGEATGKLDVMLFKLSSQLDARHTLSMKLWSASVYPIVVMCVLFLVAGGMLIWVLPDLLSKLFEAGVESGNLPMATRILIVIQGFLVNFWWLLLLILFGIYGLFVLYVGTDYGAARWDYFKLKFPVVGGFLRKVYTMRFVSMLGLLIDSGLPVISSLKIIGNSLKSRLYKLKVQELINSVKDGGKISEGLKDSEFLFSPEVADMLNVGEQSASIGKVSQKIADQYDREIDTSLKKLTSVFEPVMILFVGLFVGLLALSIMAPIFNLSSLATGS